MNSPLATFRFALQMFAQAPSGELTSLMIGRESTFGTAATPTVTAICDDISLAGTNALLDRPGARKRVGRTPAATGMFTGKGSISHEADPDNLGAWLNMTMGSETIALAYTAPTLSGATSGSTGTFPATGAYKYKVVFKTSNVAPGAAGYAAAVTGQSAEATVSVTATTQTVALTIGAPPTGVSTSFMDIYRTAAAGAALSETAIATNVAVSTTYTDTGLANGTTALPADVYTHTFTLASPRGSFTAQLNRVIDAINYLGCKISTLDFKVTEKQILFAKMGIEYVNEAYVASPVTPTYSVLNPFVFETLGNSVLVNGTSSDADVMDFSISVNTGLITDFPRFGQGRIRGQLPETMTKVSGDISLAFETETMYKNFWGAPAATGPQSTVANITLAYTMNTQDAANANFPYSLSATFAAAKLTTNSIPIKAADYLKQSAKYEGYESSNGAGNDVTFVLTNTSAVASI